MGGGRVVIHTGQGKGKTTAALGLALDCWAGGGRVLVLQFIKGGWRYGELAAAAALGERFAIVQAGLGFVRFAGEAEKAVHREAARRALAQARASLPLYDLVVLDEIIYAVGFGLLTVEEVAALVADRAPGLVLVLTGRGVPPELAALADEVVEMAEVRHHARAGVPAQRGIEY